MGARSPDLDLDLFLAQGDDQTWLSNEWAWDPVCMQAVPRGLPYTGCCTSLRSSAPPSRLEQIQGDNALQLPAAQHVQIQAPLPHYTCIPANTSVQQPTCCANTVQTSQNPMSMNMRTTMHQQGVAYYGGTIQANPNMHGSSLGNCQFLGMPQASIQPVLTGIKVYANGGQMSMHTQGANASLPSPMHAQDLHQLTRREHVYNVQSVPAAWQCSIQPNFGTTAIGIPTVACASMPTISQVPFQTSETQGSIALGSRTQTQTYVDLLMHEEAPSAVEPMWQSHNTTDIVINRPPSVQPPTAVTASIVSRIPSLAPSIISSANKRQGISALALPSVTSTVNCRADNESGEDDEGDALMDATGDAIHLDTSEPDDTACPVCQVSGCGKDLTGLKDYHLRYRICDVHIRLSQVMKDGRLQRFCQQCSRFHELSAFDAKRRSCREQLLKHNARRRRRSKAEAARTAMAEKAGVAVEEDTTEVGKLMAGLLANPSQLQALRLLLGVPAHSALPEMATYSGDSALDAHEGMQSRAQTDPSSYGLARDILRGSAPHTPTHASPELLSLRISMKLFNRTPADLPHDLRIQVAGWLSNAPVSMEGYIRPGCVFLTVDMLLDRVTYKDAEARGVLGVVEYLLNSSGCHFWKAGVFIVQMLGAMACVSSGQLLRTSQPESGVPQLLYSSHSVLLNKLSMRVQITGRHLNLPGCELVVRWAGTRVETSPLDISQLVEGADGTQTLNVTLPAATETTLFLIEVCKGGYLSEAVPVLLATNHHVVTELERFLSSSVGLRMTLAERTGLLSDLAHTIKAAAKPASQPSGSYSASIMSGTSRYNSESILAARAAALLVRAMDGGWAAVAGVLLPVVLRGCSSAAEAVQRVSKAMPNAGETLTLLHRAVRSGSTVLVKSMFAWGDEHGYEWRVDVRGPSGITPLHLAALAGQADMALLLLDRAPHAALFTMLRTDDGVTPFHLAMQMGHFTLDNLLDQLVTQASSGHVPDQKGRGQELGKPAGVAEGQKRPLPPELDPCEVCSSTVPPLLLSIVARCLDCGARHPVSLRSQRGEEEAEQAGATGPGDAAVPEEPAVKPGPVAAKGGLAPPFECRWHQGTRYSITAMCQGCYSDRMLVVV